jgi:hypothetical protein
VPPLGTKMLIIMRIGGFSRTIGPQKTEHLALAWDQLFQKVMSTKTIAMMVKPK